jgi:multimeric flavodoxin WrbA
MTGVPRLLVVHCSPPRAPEVEALEADGFLLGTPASMGYLSGSLKQPMPIWQTRCCTFTSRRDEYVTALSRGAASH